MGRIDDVHALGHNIRNQRGVEIKSQRVFYMRSLIRPFSVFRALSHLSRMPYRNTCVVCVWCLLPLSAITSPRHQCVHTLTRDTKVKIRFFVKWTMIAFRFARKLPSVWRRVRIVMEFTDSPPLCRCNVVFMFFYLPQIKIMNLCNWRCCASVATSGEGRGSSSLWAR